MPPSGYTITEIDSVEEWWAKYLDYAPRTEFLLANERNKPKPETDYETKEASVWPAAYEILGRLVGDPDFVYADCPNQYIRDLMVGGPRMSDLPFNSQDGGAIISGITISENGPYVPDYKNPDYRLRAMQSRACAKRAAQTRTFDIIDGHLDASKAIPGVLVYRKWGDDMDQGGISSCIPALFGQGVQVGERTSYFNLQLNGISTRLVNFTSGPGVVIHLKSDDKWYFLAESTFNAKGFSALAVDPAEQRADLAVLAAATCDLDDPIWPIMASSLRAFDSDEEFRALLANLSFTKPDTDAAIDQLNVLAKLAGRSGKVGEAARRLWRVAFQGRTEDLRSATGFFPADVLLESETAGFARADELALDPAGVQLQDSLASSWRFDLPKEHAPAATSKSLASVSIADQAPELFAPFQKFHELHSAVQMVLAMLGRDQTIRRVANKFTGNPGFDDICADLDNASNRLHGLCDPLPAHMQQMKLVVIPLKNGQALVLSAAGTPMMARAEDDGALLYGCTKGDTPHSWQLSMATVEPRDLEHATRLLRDAVSKLSVPIGMRLRA